MRARRERAHEPAGLVADLQPPERAAESLQGRGALVGEDGEEAHRAELAGMGGRELVGLEPMKAMKFASQSSYGTAADAAAGPHSEIRANAIPQRLE